MLSLLALCVVPALRQVLVAWQTKTRAAEPRAALSLPLAPSLELASWSDVGGCGVSGGGASSTGGGTKWIGRGVLGGQVDLQCLSSETFTREGSFFSFSTRLAKTLWSRWSFALNVPVLYKSGDVDVLGVDRQAGIWGFGDLSLELSRKLGVDGASQVSLLVSAPTGSHDAVRQGVILPQHLQLGSGVLGLSAIFEHTIDYADGLLLMGGVFSYNGWENDLGDFRAPSIATYIYWGYLLGPFVPSAGMTLSAKLQHDRQGDRSVLFQPSSIELDRPAGLATFQLGLEWSNDYLALLVAATAPFSGTRWEGISLSLGLSSSLF